MSLNYIEKMKKTSKILILFAMLFAFVTLAACGGDDVSFKTKSISLNVGDSLELQVSGVKDRSKLEWVSDNDKIAEVDEEGVVYATGTGTTQITVKVKETSKSDTIEVVVDFDGTVSFKDSKAEVGLGSTLTLKPDTNPVGNVAFTWSSKDPAVATVDQNGKVTPVKLGSTTITATYKDKSATITVDVVLIAPTSIIIDYDGSNNVKVLDRVQLAVLVFPKNALSAVNWSTSNPAVATVDEDGLVEFVGTGSVIITAAAKEAPTVTDDFTFIVSKPDPVSITVKATGDVTKVSIHQSLQMIAEVSPEHADQGVFWSSSNETVGVVDIHGVFYGYIPGEVVITAKSNVDPTITGTFTLTVFIPEPEEVVVTGRYNKLLVDEEMDLKVSVLPEKAVQTVTFESTNTSVVTVDANGNIKAIGLGSAKVVVKSTVDPDVKFEYDIDVVEAITGASLDYIVLDGSLTAGRFEAISYNGKDLIMGVNAFTDLVSAFEVLQDDSTLYIASGEYVGVVEINNNNILITGPNKDINPVTDLEDRVEESIIKGYITLGEIQNLTIEGIKFAGRGQILSEVPQKNHTFNNLYFDSTEGYPDSQGNIYFRIPTDDNLYSENIIVTNTIFLDRLNNRSGVRINNVKNITIEGNDFTGYVEPIRLEGTDNEGWGLSDWGKGSGVSGVANINNNRLVGAIQYPILFSRHTATEVNIRNNYIAVSPSGYRYGLIILMNYIKGDYSTVVNVEHNIFPDNTSGHEVRFYSRTATNEQYQINVNYNIWTKAPATSHIAEHDESGTFNINAKYNVFLYGAPQSNHFFKGAEYEPYFTSVEDLEEYLALIDREIYFEDEQVSLPAATSKQLVAKLKYPTVELAWSSSDNKVVSVDQTGKITGIKEGSAKITATIVGTEESASIMVYVLEAEPEEVEIEYEHSILMVEEQMQVDANVLPLIAPQGVVYSSSAPTIATVSASGLVEALAPGTVKIKVSSAEDATVFKEVEIVVVAKVTFDYSEMYVDASLTGDRFDEVLFETKEYYLGATAFASLEDALNAVKDGTILYLEKGTYSGNLQLNVNNVTIYGPNKGTTPVGQLASRVDEAVIASNLVLGQIENLHIDGVEFSDYGQITSLLPQKGHKFHNLLFHHTIDVGKSIYFLIPTDDSLSNDDIEVRDSYFLDEGNSDNAIRINNAKNLRVENNHIDGYWEQVRLEGTNNSGWGQTEKGTGIGAAGEININNNILHNAHQYSILFGRHTATEVNIIGNEIILKPTGFRYGFIILMNYVKGDYVSVVNVLHNVFPDNTAGNELRFYSKEATPAQYQINVNYNIWHKAAVTTHIADHDNDPAFTINGTHNVFLYGTPNANHFFSGTVYEPYYATIEDLEAYLDSIE